MKSYIYELVVWRKEKNEKGENVGIKIKRFIGNNKSELEERFEKWFIKQPYTRDDIYFHIGEIQHAGYR